MQCTVHWIVHIPLSDMHLLAESNHDNDKLSEEQYSNLPSSTLTNLIYDKQLPRPRIYLSINN